MPLDDKVLDSLCDGRIIIAKLCDSLDSAFPKDRPAIVISTVQQAKRGRIRVVGVTNNDEIGKGFLIPMPGYTGFKGHIDCSFTPWIEEADIKEAHGNLSVPDRIKVLALVRKADIAKKAAKKSTRS